MSDTLSTEVIAAMTGYEQPSMQLKVLHERGFVRACRNRHGTVILERSHYDAVCRGQFATMVQAPKAQGVRTDFLKASA